MIVPCKSCRSAFRLDSRLVKSTGLKVRCSKCGTTFKVYPPQPNDQRKHTRVMTRNLISCFSFDENGKLISHGLGIALDISKGGILLETPEPVESGLLVLSAVDWENNLVEVKGKLIYSKKSSIGTYLSGIELVGVDGRVKNFITKLIKDYNYRGYNLFIAIAHKIQNLHSRSISG